jgi:prepilin-type N-terminal cleavage/methylation domain-containing protein
MTKTRFSKGAAGGFSMIELLVAITIGGVLLSIAWVRMSTLVPIYRLEGAARDLAAEVQKARGRAIAENRCFQVLIDTSNKTYQLQNGTTTNSSSCAGVTFAASPGDGVLGIDDANALTVAFAQGSNPVFTPRGAAYLTGGAQAPQITLTNTAGAVRSIFVQSTGRVNVQ